MPVLSPDDPDFPMPPKKEETIIFRCDEATKGFIYRTAGDLDVSVSDLCRACVLLAAGQVRAVPGLLTIGLKDIRSAGERP